MNFTPPTPDSVLDKPVFILSAPRSGSTLLFETLSQAPGIWTVGGESHWIFEHIPNLRPGAPGVRANRLTEAQATKPICDALKTAFLRELIDRDSRKYIDGNPSKIRMLEKTPKNALRVPFLNAVFPDALFIYLYREPRSNVSSIMDAWRSGGWVTYPRLPGWNGPWSLLLPPGWRELAGKPLAEISAYQWLSANKYILKDLEKIARPRWTIVNYKDLVDNPECEISRLCEFMGCLFDDRIFARTTGQLPLSRYTLTPPSPDKWKKNIAELSELLPLLDSEHRNIERMIANYM